MKDSPWSIATFTVHCAVSDCYHYSFVYCVAIKDLSSLFVFTICRTDKRVSMYDGNRPNGARRRPDPWLILLNLYVDQMIIDWQNVHLILILQCSPGVVKHAGSTRCLIWPCTHMPIFIKEYIINTKPLAVGHKETVMIHDSTITFISVQQLTKLFTETLAHLNGQL